LGKIAVIGLGYVGLTSAVGLASLGHSVIGIDTDSKRVEALRTGTVPIFEPGIQAVLKENLANGNLNFSDSYETLDSSTEFAFICVPTPSTQKGGANLDFVDSAINSLSSRLGKGSILVMKSTVPIGTSSRYESELKAHDIHVVSNPEFLQEGSALYDFQNPSRIVVGASNAIAANKVMSLYEKVSAPRLSCGLTSAETVKHASNSFLALRLSFVNELAALCEKTGASMSEVTQGMSLDSRIGSKFLNAGPGWGGSCFPKDTNELAHTARSFGLGMLTVESAIESNHLAIKNVSVAMVKLMGGNVSRKKIAVWGLAFKANTDDLRDSPAMRIVEDLVKEGATVLAYDPIAKPRESNLFILAESPLEACFEADGLLVLTESEDFKSIRPENVASSMTQNPVVFDARRILERTEWSKHFAKFRVLGN